MFAITLYNYKKYKRIVGEMEQGLGREVMLDEFIDETGLSMEDAMEILDFVEKGIKDFNEIDNERYEFILRQSIANNEFRKLRIKSELTQKELASKVGVSNGKIGTIENCRAYPDDYLKERLASFFKVSSESLFPKWLEQLARNRREMAREKVIEVGKLYLADNNKEILRVAEKSEVFEKDDFDRNASLPFLKKHIKEAFEKLTTREQQIISMHFGLKSGVPLLLEEVGNKLGVTRERIRQIEAKALEKIRDNGIVMNKFKEYQY